MSFICKEQLGGFHNITLFSLEETSNWPQVVEDHNTQEIIFTPFAACLQARIMDDSVQVTATPSVTDSGMQYRVRIQWDYIIQSPQVDYMLDQYATHPVVVAVCKKYKQTKLYGTDKYPLHVRYQNLDGRRAEDGSLTRIFIEGTIPVRPVWLLRPEVS